ncbi:MAG TPA: uroporphyrinogen decarboxylase family protein [Bdellovibrionales bacterium]|nr:uroporphyrinogen decarboxylase family protein [Bdellovibrionales bacterium]
MANDRFIKALKREPQAVPPIWFMRQAGRYHAHYQALRAKHSFIEMCRQPDLAAEVAMGPIRDFDFDVAILFSDILFPLDAMGMGLSYDPAPALQWHVDETTIAKLRSPDEAIGELRFQKDAVTATRKVLPKEKSLIGFIGGPWTLFTYAVEGSHKGGLEKAKRLARLYPVFCEKMLPLLQKNIELQFEGGAEVVMIFDTAAGELSPAFYNELVVPTLETLARTFPKRLGYYAKGVQAAHFKHEIFGANSPWVGQGYDHRWDIASVLQQRPYGFVQGNFDQSLLFMSPAEFKAQAIRYLEPIRALGAEKRAGWVSGLGHGVLPGTPEENVRSFVKLIREVMA